MTYEDARRLAEQTKRDHADLRVGIIQAAEPDGRRVIVTDVRQVEWDVTVQEPGAADWITLPDALSVRAYLDARRGYRTVSGAPDFGPGGV